MKVCLGEHIENIIKTIIFDSLIGNSDRHQENWGFIMPYKETELTGEEANRVFSKLKDRFKQIKDLLKKNENFELDAHVKVKILGMKGDYAPIYDSGCCLAKEKTEDAVRQMLNDRTMFDSFINRGKSEIRWGDKGEKINHFDLVSNIRMEFPAIVEKVINNIISLYDENKIRNIVFNIDKELPEEFREEYALSSQRKELICRLINERFLRLKNIVL